MARRTIRHFATLTLSKAEREGRLNISIANGSTKQGLWRILTLKTAVKGVLYLPKRGLPQYPCHI